MQSAEGAVQIRSTAERPEGCVEERIPLILQQQDDELARALIPRPRQRLRDRGEDCAANHFGTVS
jgi:hypothetical protein